MHHTGTNITCTHTQSEREREREGERERERERERKNYHSCACELSCVKKGKTADEFETTSERHTGLFFSFFSAVLIRKEVRNFKINQMTEYRCPGCPVSGVRKNLILFPLFLD